MHAVGTQLVSCVESAKFKLKNNDFHTLFTGPRYFVDQNFFP